MEEENKVEENVQPVETPVETTPVVETSPVVEEVKDEPKENKPKNNKPMLIVLLIIFMAFIFGCGMYLGKQLFEKENKCSCNCEPCNTEPTPTPVPTPEPEPTVMIKDITDEVKNNTEADSIYIKENVSEDYQRIYINSNEIDVNSFYKSIYKVYSIGDNYLFSTTGTDINTLHYYLYDKNGNFLQELYELEGKNMVIASSDKYMASISFNDNYIELYGTRLTHGPSLVMNNDGQRSEYYLCDKNQLANANVDDNYIVIAKYQLIYSNNKFDIKRVEGTEITLGEEVKESCKE